MDCLPFLFLLYLGSNVSAANECNRCKCCKTDRCRYYNRYHNYCIDGCIDGYYGTRCTHACMTNCLQCENLSSCTKCRNGFYLDGHSCTECPQNCVNCSSNSNCNTCRDGFYSAYYYDCRHKCQDNCESCTSYSGCTSCKSGFYNGKEYTDSWFSYSDCRHSCKDSCTSCTSYYTCTDCKDGNYNGNYNDCTKSCHSACKSCTSYNKCTKCETGKYGELCQNDCSLGCENHECDLTTGNCKCVSGFQGDKCDQCEPGVYSANCSIPCPTRCLENDCKLNGDCYSCKSGFNGPTCEHCVSGLYGINCDTPCPAGCAYDACSINGYCTYGCKNSFAGTSCDQCVDGKYGNNCDQNCLENCIGCTTGASCSLCSPRHWGSTCLSCPLNCSNCNSNTSCSSCDPWYYGNICNANCPNNCLNGICDKTNGICSFCNEGFYGNRCYSSCPENCAGNKCNIDGNCGFCQKGYYGQNCSTKCPANCEECNINGNSCIVCTDGYYGTDCDRNCTAYNCKTCDKMYGQCTECVDGFFLYNKHCLIACKTQCKKCIDNSYMCTACKDGKFGPYPSSEYLHCTSNCSENCLNISCDGKTGACNNGCVTGSWGDKCQLFCPKNCKNGECYANNGTCVLGCEKGYVGPECTCPVNCECDAFGNCHKCKERFHTVDKNCTCTTELCTDKICTGCYNSTHYARNGLCCPCSSSCLDKICDSVDKCTNGCVDGHYKDDCSGLCKSFDQNCLKCKSKLSLSGGICLQCIPGYYIGNTIKTSCRTCSEHCKDGICDSINGTCTVGCNDGHWGDRCESLCEKYCFKCNQVNGECSICKNGTYFKNCTKECSPNCNSTDDIIMCGIDDGACLNGCDNLKKYGTHCEHDCNFNCLNISCNWKTGFCLNGCVDNFFGVHCNKACSVNCVRGGGRRCDDVNGHCIHECKVGFHGDTCEKTCSENCVNNTCEKETRKCFHGCKKGFSGSSCSIAQTGGDEDTTFLTVGASIGASVLVLIIITVIVLIIMLKRRRTTTNEEMIDMTRTNVNAAVINSEILTSGHVIDHNDTGAVYAMPNKPKRNVPESKSPKESTETKTARNPNHEKVKGDSAAVYENAVVRDSQQTAAKENARQFVKSALEIEEDLNDIAYRESKTMTQTDGSCTYDSEAADTYYNVTAVKKRRIMLDKLADFVSTKTKEDFVEEFLQLPPGLIKPYIESQKRKNAPKNRYKGVYPYDDTRVVLKDGDSDYINASYIDGYVQGRAYIASIGPTYKYMGDMSAFWKMVWQEQVGKIVMLTNLSEAGVAKCDQYWPDKDFSELYANVQVTCKSEEAYADYTVRSFVAQKGSEKRSIVQVHFTAWPDKGIPDDVTSLIEFRQKVNSIKTKLDGPIIVHCSAGIGRTGTYIALDSLTLEGEVEGGVDIYACVRNLREQRFNMVQTAEQYRYLHNAVVHTLTFDSKAVEATKFSEYMYTHTDVHLAENFQKLQSSVENRQDDEIEAVMKNKSLNNKNRKGADIPGNRNRPRLYLERNLGSSDYINALYINSFKSVNRYIVAQTPIPDTVGDFLALIVQEKVTCVIDMESHVTKQDNVGAYFQADNQTLKKGTFTVKSEPGENTDQYIFRKLIVSHKKSEEITVKHIQFTKWDDKNDLPEDPGKFVQFIRDIELKYCDSEKEGPILVHCLTGAEKSGLFCAVSVLLEKTQIDQEISVVNTVRQIKYRRHMSVPNKEQYIFCHQCLNEYLRSFDTYSNFGLKV